MPTGSKWKPGSAAVVCAASILAAASAGAAQDANIVLPVDSVEKLFTGGSFEVVGMQPSRPVEGGDRTDRVAMSFEGGTMLAAQWAVAPPRGEEFNNVPRYEVAAYELQKLFLEPEEYVVPPTVVRAFDLAWIREYKPRARVTFRGTESVLVVLQYWLFSVAGDREDFWDEDRFATDTAYAHHMANLNIFTYLIDHKDANQGNFLISTAVDNPRIFSVDNGVAFRSERSDRGTRWNRLHVDGVPKATVDRLRALTEEDLRRQLETLAQFRIEADGTLTAVAPEPATNPNRGIRRADDVIQLGLDRREIRDVWRRIERLLDWVDDGDLETF